MEEMNSQTDLSSIKKPEAGSRNCARRFRVDRRVQESLNASVE
jgi:hypothetical protein